MNDDEYVALVEEVQRIIEDNSLRMHEAVRTRHRETLWNEPGLSISDLLWADVLNEVSLPDDVVARLWEIGFTLGYERDFLLSEEGAAMARQERRTRPEAPVAHPLRGGGHGSGRGQPGKTEYPARWSDDDAIAYVMSVATEPAGAVRLPAGTFRAWGVRDGVDLRVILDEDGVVVTAYPVAGDGVIVHPVDDARAPYVKRLRHLAEGLAEETGVHELIAVGEWDQAVLQLRALAVEPATELLELGRLAGL